MAQTQSYDAVAMVLARSMKSPADLEIDRQRFRSRARRDARTVLRNYRSPQQFYGNVETTLEVLCGQDRLMIFTPAVAVALLQRGLEESARLVGTPYYIGNKHMAIRSRLVQARFFRRFGFSVLS